MIDYRFRHQTTADAFGDALRRFARLIRKYVEDQPRVPAGSPEGGQWVGGGDAASSVVDELGDAAASLPSLLLAGGFGKEDMGKTVQDFVAEKCKGSVYEMLPGQFLDLTVSEVLALSRSGDATARRCKKLLDRDDYRK